MEAKFDDTISLNPENDCVPKSDDDGFISDISKEEIADDCSIVGRITMGAVEDCKTVLNVKEAGTVSL